jgi:dihydrofolate synthase/folylpolyglutamate synthase
MMDYKSILHYLYSLESPEIKLGLENVESLLEKIGNPQKEIKCIHIAGTNGKGSVCAMLFYALREAGYKVGLYTSPHLKKFNERIRVNDKFISDREIVEYFIRIKPFITEKGFLIQERNLFRFFKPLKLFD